MGVKQKIKNRLKEVRLNYWRWRYQFSVKALVDHLGELGIERGDTLLVHSSFDRFVGFEGSPLDVIQALKDAVGTDGAGGGNLIVPTLPFSGTAIAYAESGAVFDQRRTPSQMGLLTEMFRRSKGVVRSLHPTHSVAVMGPDAEAIVKDHHLADTPCGPGTPYAQLVERNGKQLFLGAEIEAMTLFHYMEAVIEKDMPFSPFTPDYFDMTSRDRSKQAFHTHTRLFNPHWSRRHEPAMLIPELKALGHWTTGRVGMVDTILLSAVGTIDAGRNMAARGEYCYTDQGDPPGSSDPN